MIVRAYMSQPPIVTGPDTPISEALQTMRQRRIRRLPVVDHAGRLVGIVSERDLLHAEPSSATSLSVWEITYLLSRITVKEVMTKDVVTVRPDSPMEQAAQMLSDRKIGGLPVVDDGALVGVITETDIFRVFTELLSAHEHGIAVTAIAVDRPGLLADITRAIAAVGGDISAIASHAAPPGAGDSKAAIFVKVSGVAADALVAAIQPFVERIEEVRA